MVNFIMEYLLELYCELLDLVDLIFLVWLCDLLDIGLFEFRLSKFFIEVVFIRLLGCIVGIV